MTAAAEPVAIAVPGLSSAGEAIARGADDAMWIAEPADPGAIARVTTAGVVTEFKGGTTHNLSANSDPSGLVASGGALWFALSGGEDLGSDHDRRQRHAFRARRRPPRDVAGGRPGRAAVDDRRGRSRRSRCRRADQRREHGHAVHVRLELELEPALADRGHRRCAVVRRERRLRPHRPRHDDRRDHVDRRRWRALGARRRAAGLAVVRPRRERVPARRSPRRSARAPRPARSRPGPTARSGARCWGRGADRARRDRRTCTAPECRPARADWASPPARTATCG